MKPYSPLGSVRHGGYSVLQCHGLPSVTRPTKNAAGMSYTFSRHHSFGKPSFPVSLGEPTRVDVLRLVISGTLDPLRNGKALNGLTLPKHCPCCGAITKARKLSDAGDKRLEKLRERWLNRRAAHGVSYTSGITFQRHDGWYAHWYEDTTSVAAGPFQTEGDAAFTFLLEDGDDA